MLYDCYDMFKVVLLLCGDIEKYPGPSFDDLKAQLEATAGNVKGIKKGEISTDALISETNTRLATTEARVEGLLKVADKVAPYQNRIASLEKNVSFLLDKDNNLENRSRHNNLIVYGIKETEDENKNMLNTCTKNSIFGAILGTQITGIECIHRLGYKAANKKWLVILKLLDKRDKISILSNFRRLKGSAFSESEDFSPRVQQIRKQMWDSAKELKKKGDKVVLLSERIKINEPVFVWDGSANARVPLYPPTHKKNSN